MRAVFEPELQVIVSDIIKVYTERLKNFTFKIAFKSVVSKSPCMYASETVLNVSVNPGDYYAKHSTNNPSHGHKILATRNRRSSHGYRRKVVWMTGLRRYVDHRGGPSSATNPVGFLA